MSVTRSITRILFLLAIVASALLLAAGCTDDSGSSDDSSSDETSESADEDTSDGGGSSDVADRNGMYDKAPTEKLDPAKEYVVEVETNKGTFDINVDPKAAPIAAANFVYLVEQGFYDGTSFHRIMKDFMIQGGDPSGDGTGGPGYTIEDEPVKGKYSDGAIAMARTPAPNSAGSQFFIVHGDTGDQNLTRDYIIFGNVDKTDLKVIDEIANVEVEASATGEPSSPVEPVEIISAKLK